MSSRATVFGLDVESDLPLLLLEGSTAHSTGRSLKISGPDSTQTDLRWPSSAELLCDERQPDGSLVFQIEAHPDAGYLISGPQYGAHLLSADGRELRCAPKGNPDEAWQRLLIAQVLPFAALLQGLEVLHASAIVRDGKAVAFLGPSRAGKTSLALELCAIGASFLADDVLALEPRDENLLAHPGTPIAGVDRLTDQPSDNADTRADGAPATQVVAVNDRERLVRMDSAAEPAQLDALFFLDRRVDGPEHPSFESTVDAQMLLAATFNFVLATPERLQRLLNVSALAARLRVERIIIGPGTSSSEVGAEVAQRMSEPG